VPNSFTIDQTETTNQVILISLNGNVYTDEFPFELRTRLFNRERFAIARESCNERRVEKIGLNNFFDICEITKADEGIIFLWDKVLFNGRKGSRCLVILLKFFLNSQFPLATTSLVFIKFLSNSLIGGAVNGTPCTNISSSYIFTIE
jgi:hypothetical protein